MEEKGVGKRKIARKQSLLAMMVYKKNTGGPEGIVFQPFRDNVGGIDAQGGKLRVEPNVLILHHLAIMCDEVLEGRGGHEDADAR